ncbi:MAG: type II secretion system protein GspG [Planctomycetes bacterium]|nr:type II secretion system protein GspG [Planctomycetota bacterium]
MTRRQHAHIRPGFSLIELMLVLVILAVLAAVVATRFTGTSERARVTAAKTDIASLETALDAFEVDAGRFPSSEEGLLALVEVPAGMTEDNWHGPYIKRGVPKDPWGNEYVYQFPGRVNTRSFDLSSNGPDGQAGSEDDIVNWDKDTK